MAFTKTYLHLLKVVADTTQLPQAFFDNPNRQFTPIVTIDDETNEEVLTARDATNTTISEGLEACRATRGTVRVYTKDGSDFIICGIPNLTQWEMIDTLKIWDAYGDDDFACLLSHEEALKLDLSDTQPTIQLGVIEY